MKKDKLVKNNWRLYQSQILAIKKLQKTKEFAYLNETQVARYVLGKGLESIRKQ